MNAIDKTLARVRENKRGHRLLKLGIKEGTPLPVLYKLQ